jgi:acetyl-CoA synthetase
MSNLSGLKRLTAERYAQWYQQSLDDPDTFWAKMATDFLEVDTPWERVSHTCFAEGQIAWFEGATLNLSTNCLDRHLPTHANAPALIFEGDSPDNAQTFTYQQLLEQVCQMANTLKALGVKKGDRVCLYLPMIPMTAIAMLACARIGAVHTVVFAGFSPVALRDRVIDANCSVIITADENVRGGKNLPLKNNVNEALKGPNPVTQVLIVRNTGRAVVADPLRDVWYHEVAPSQAAYCPAEPMQAEDPLFILYTSGSTGQPKGVLHTTGGYALYSAMTYRWVFDIEENDVFWCTADAGWITGHTYSLYGPLLNASTTLWFEGVPTYPTASRLWEIIDKHQVTIFYTAPTALRSLMALGDAPVQKTSRASLKRLGSVGEPINPEAWQWYHDVVGNGDCDIIDTWWQTETGGIMLAPLPNVAHQKPGYACLPFFGVKPAIVDDNGTPLSGEAEGHLVITASWPGQMRTIYGDHQRFIDTYLTRFPGCYATGDGARRDDEGDISITGRTDDIINMSGHRIGTAEVESALVQHPHIAEAAVVGVPHPVKGQALYAFVHCMEGQSPDEALKTELLGLITHHIGKFASTCQIQWCRDLPKTRSGKIMRRILRALAVGDLENLGDTSTLANPEIVETLTRETKPLTFA